MVLIFDRKTACMMWQEAHVELEAWDVYQNWVEIIMGALAALPLSTLCVKTLRLFTVN
jgi:hypothetical protein